MITSKDVWTIEDAPDDAGRIDHGSITLGLVCHREITTARAGSCRQTVSRRRVMDARIELRRRAPVVVLFYSTAAKGYAAAEGHRLIAQILDTVTDLNDESPIEGRIEITDIRIDTVDVEDLGRNCTRVTVEGPETEAVALAVSGFFGEEVTEIAMGAW